jgi:hypothetical protein
MAAGTVTRDVKESENDKAFIKCTWVLTTADPSGAQIAIPEFNEKVWTIGNAAGDAFGGATCSLQGVNATGDTLVTLNKAAGGATATAAAAATISTIENTLFVAPVLTAVGAGATITVTLLARRANILRN